MKSQMLGGVALAMLCAACSTTGTATMDNSITPAAQGYEPAIPQATSIFAERSQLPFHAPDYDGIADSEWQGAIEEAIAIELAEIAAIRDNPAPATFANTIVAMERAGQVFDRAYMAFGQKRSANTNDVIAAANEALAPQISAKSDATYLDPKLFARVKAVYDNRAAMAMTPEDARLLEVVYARFVHSGALLSDADKEELTAINQRLSELSSQVSRKITEASNDDGIMLASREALAGLSEGQVANAAKAASERGKEGMFYLSLSNTTGQPLLASLDNRATREQLLKASMARNIGGENDTTALAKEMIELRQRVADIFEQPDYATWYMYDRMVKRPEAAVAFMSDMVPALRATQEREAEALQERIAEDGHNFALKPWDWEYYASKLQAEKYALDNEAIKQYLVVDRVLEDGVFYMANKLYGLTFEKRSDIPVYHPDVSVYTVFDESGEAIALFYFDPYSRPSKRGGAWNASLVKQSHLLGLKTVVTNTQNIAPPAPGEPALATWDDVTTMFHEFGHAVHNLLSDGTYPQLTGSSGARDWVEFPSQFHEPFAALPEVLRNYARHHETGEVMPAEMIAAIDRASKFNQGHSFGEIVSASLLDLGWHSLPPNAEVNDVMGFEETALAQTGLNTALVPPRYRTPYYRHIFEHGYQAGYHSYTWTEMLAHDAFAWVMANGGMTRENGEKVRDAVLSRGKSREYAQMYRDLTGRDPKVEALLEARGLLQGDAMAGAAAGAEGAL